MVPLGEVAKVVSGATPKTGVSAYWGGQIAWATPADLGRLDGAYIARTPRTLTEAGLRSCTATVLPTESVLLSSRAPIGHVALNAVPMATNQGFKSLVPQAGLNPKYLFYWLRAHTDYLQSLGNGATFKELSKKTVEQIEIPLPSVEEQRRIAAILDKADAIRAKRRQVLAHLDALTQSIFHDMFGEDGDATAELQDVCRRITDGTHQSPEWVDEGVPFLFVSNITSGEIDMQTQKFISKETWVNLTRRTPIEVGDVLYSTVGSYGIPALVRSDEPFAFQRHIAHIKPDPAKLDSTFLATQMAAVQVKRQATRAARGVAQPTVNLADIKKFVIVLPPMADQRAFAAIVSRISAEKQSVRTAGLRDGELFASLQSRAFRGEL